MSDDGRRYNGVSYRLWKGNDIYHRLIGTNRMKQLSRP